MTQAVAFSGGKDSTAMALLLAERGEDFVLLFTPTGNELPELDAHLRHVQELTGKTLIVPENKPLVFWIDFYKALPNWRMLQRGSSFAHPSRHSSTAVLPS